MEGKKEIDLEMELEKSWWRRDEGGNGVAELEKDEWRDAEKWR